MSESNVNSVLSSNRLIVRGFLGAILVAGLMLILPLYMQNRLTKLYTKSHELALQIGQLERERTLQQLEINKLSSLENLSVFAEETGLGLNSVPTKVRITGAP
ncbi:MAG: hypothetical protein SPL21_07625 [Fibrobacter sp.]|nr:hypothetical protein [Fibrobacter sp.]